MKRIEGIYFISNNTFCNDIHIRSRYILFATFQNVLSEKNVIRNIVVYITYPISNKIFLGNNILEYSLLLLVNIAYYC